MDSRTLSLCHAFSYTVCPPWPVYCYYCLSFLCYARVANKHLILYCSVFDQAISATFLITLNGINSDNIIIRQPSCRGFTAHAATYDFDQLFSMRVRSTLVLRVCWLERRAHTSIPVLYIHSCS